MGFSVVALSFNKVGHVSQNSNSISAEGEDGKLLCRWLVMRKIRSNPDSVSQTGKVEAFMKGGAEKSLLSLT